MDDIQAELREALIPGFQGDFEACQTALVNLVSRAPNKTDILYELAMTQLMLGKIDEGCANLRRVLAIDPTHERALQLASYC